MSKSMYKYPYMILIVIYCKLKVKQALYELKCDNEPLNVIIFRESLTTKLPWCIYNRNMSVYSTACFNLFFNKGGCLVSNCCKIAVY